MQALLPTGAVSPCAHAVHVIWPGSENVSIGHMVQSVVPVIIENRPLGHMVQTVDPVKALNVPGAHGKHVVWPIMPWYMPAGQLMQSRPPGLSMVPAGHIVAGAGAGAGGRG
jgi:hypothetical protein